MKRVSMLGAIVFASCIHYSTTLAPASELASVAASINAAPDDVIVVAAGDIADCNRLAGARATAALVQLFPSATVLTIGDNAYPNGSAKDFARCFEPTWGAFKSRIKPSPGNHEHQTPNAAGYTAYFGVPLYYSFDLGKWHIVSLDSMLDMSAASPQTAWLRGDLAANAQQCILAFWHHPRFSSGFHGRQRSDAGRRTGELWNVLAAHHAALILDGHDHDYERFAPVQGIREIVVGTGGAELRPFTLMRSGGEFADDRHLGVLVLTLHPSSYDWRFLSIDGQVRDRSAAPEPCVR
jgi:3',5'-cyclic AMP phosphodiesterase CpdA